MWINMIDLIIKTYKTICASIVFVVFGLIIIIVDVFTTAYDKVKNASKQD